MRQKNYYSRFIPVRNYDMAGMEAWLSDMAEQGFILSSLGFFLGSFTKAEPKPVRYQLEPAGNDWKYPNMTLCDYYKINGWRYITTYRRTFHVFRAEDAAARAIQSNPVVQSAALKKTSRRLLHMLLVFLVIMASFFGPAISFAFDNLVGNLVPRFNFGVYFVIPAVIFATLYVIASAVRSSRLRRRLLSGQPAGEPESRKRSTAFKLLEVAALIALILVLSAKVITSSKSALSGPDLVANKNSNMPVLSLADIDPEQYVYYDNGGFNWDYSPLTPVQYTTHQSIRKEDPYFYRTVLSTLYYKLAFSGLAKPVYDEKIQTCYEDNEKLLSCDTLDTGLFDEAVYIRTEYTSDSMLDDIPETYITQRIIAYRDKTIVKVYYVGDEYLPDKLELIAETFLQ